MLLFLVKFVSTCDQLSTVYVILSFIKSFVLKSFKDTLLSTDFDVKKDPREAECWIHKTSLMLLTGYNRVQNFY